MPKGKKADAPGKVVAELNGLPVRRVRVGDLRLADWNPREIADSSLDGLRASVETFGMVQPVVWNQRSGNVVGGHQRLRTLDPDSETDVVVVDLDPERERALNVALNNRHIQGEWTTSLAEVLEEIDAAVPELSETLHLDELYEEVARLSGQVGSGVEGDLPPPDLGSSERGPGAPAPDAAPRHAIEVEYASAEARQVALDRLASVGGATLATSLDEALGAWEQRQARIAKRSRS